MQNNFWKNKKVLITGYEGFLGSNLTQRLINYGARIWGLDIVTYRKNTLLSREDYKRIKVIKGSIANYALLDKIIKKNRIEIIFHLAAEAIVGKCQSNPLGAFSSNIKGTWSVLEASRLSKTVKSIIIASSDKAYGSHKKLPYTEEHSLCGAHTYDVSKSCADLLARAYFVSYGLPVAITRCGNIFGPGDFNFSRIITDTIRSIIKNKTLIIRSDGKFTRDYVYVDDIVDGYLLIAEKMNKLGLAGEAFNLSNENPISVLGLVKEIYKISKQKPKYRILSEAQHEIRDQYLSSVKARKILGWKAKHSLEGGLTKTIYWYKENLCK
ncbi:MAG: NAD-dependent epimerase/dehydratase family protein [Candidatus Omnitrophota bacterium]|jgi:CDP-glucose 4,6-dehydratase